MSQPDVNALRAAYGRAALLGVGAAAVVGAGSGVLLSAGYPGVLPIYAASFAAGAVVTLGVLIGVVAVVMVATHGFSARSRRFRVLVSGAVIGLGTLALSAWLLQISTSGWWWSAPIAAIAAVVAAALSGWAERQAKKPGTEPPARHRTISAFLAIVIGGAAVLPTASATVSLLREQLHVMCSYGIPGTEGANTWHCADGISYLGAGILLIGVAAFAVIFGLMALAIDRHGRGGRRVLTLLAIAVVTTGIAGTLVASTSFVRVLPPGVAGIDYWIMAVLPAAIVAAVSIGVAIVSLGVPPQRERIFGWVALSGLFATTVMQPGLGISTLPAIGLLLAATLRTDRDMQSAR